MQGIDIVRATEIKERLDDYQALTMTLWGEARGLSERGKYAVGCVIKNRLAIKFRGAKSIKDVCLARLQFSCWFVVGGVQNYQRVLQVSLVMLDEPSTDWPISLKACADVAKQLLGPTYNDITSGATHYYHESIATPSWARVPGALLTCDIDGHLFYKNIK